MEKGVLKYGEYDGEQSEPIRVDRDRESQTRVKKHAEKAEKIRVSTDAALAHTQEVGYGMCPDLVR